MIISDLKHIEAVSEVTGILGGKNDKSKNPKSAKKTPIINVTVNVTAQAIAQAQATNTTAEAIAQAQATATTSITGTTPTA